MSAPERRREAIAQFEAGCETEQRADGTYIKRREVAEWAGPYKSPFEALRAYRLVFFVD